MTQQGAPDAAVDAVRTDQQVVAQLLQRAVRTNKGCGPARQVHLLHIHR